MILDIYKDAFEFSGRKIPNLLILGVLSFLYFLIIPGILFYGYEYRVIKQSTQSMINGKDEPPKFDDFKKMFIDGLKYIAVAIVYLLIPIIIFIAASFTQGAVNVVLIILGIIVGIISNLLLCVAIPHMANNDDSLSSAFSISEITKIIASIGYGRFLLAFIGIVLISAVVFAVVFVLLMIVLVLLTGVSASFSIGSVESMGLVSNIVMNAVLLFIVAPYMALFQSRCVGLLYNLGS